MTTCLSLSHLSPKSLIVHRLCYRRPLFENFGRINMKAVVDVVYLQAWPTFGNVVGCAVRFIRPAIEYPSLRFLIEKRFRRVILPVVVAQSNAGVDLWIFGSIGVRLHQVRAHRVVIVFLEVGADLEHVLHGRPDDGGVLPFFVSVHQDGEEIGALPHPGVEVGV